VEAAEAVVASTAETVGLDVECGTDGAAAKPWSCNGP
jgi:hypothetical protein